MERDRTLKGRTVLITGAYRNMGAVIAETFAERGAAVIVNDVAYDGSQQDGQALTERLESYGVGSWAFEGDIGTEKGVAGLAGEIADRAGQHVDIVVNNAGPFNADPFTQLEPRDWETVVNVNLKAIYLTARQFAPGMRERGWGRIVNMSAGSGFVRNHGVYGLAKAAVITLTESLALELGPEITVNAIAPGQIEESLPIIHQIDPDFGERYLSKSALNTLVNRGDIARAIVSICGPEFDKMTGQTLRIDGGAEIQRF